MALLLGLMLAAAAGAAPAATSPAVAPLVTRACAKPALTCRLVDSFGMMVSPTEAVTVKVDKELQFTVADNLVLMLGESVVFKINNGALTLASSGKAPVAALNPLIDRALGQTSASVEAIKPPANQVRISLVQAPGRPDVFLFVENGYADKGLTYGAAIVSVNNVELPTTVCPATAGKIDIEHWPFAFPTLHLNGFKQVDKSTAC
ncbi:MAG: hypothetical protein JWM33_3097 [Caulobacteraceae bacterium]|nr:hypothetical protein [Caulobacteraceae bacterium]